MKYKILMKELVQEIVINNIYQIRNLMKTLGKIQINLKKYIMRIWNNLMKVKIKYKRKDHLKVR